MSLTEEQEAAMIEKYSRAQDETDGASSPLERLRRHCLASGVSGIRTIGRIFKRLDENGDKKLDIYELQCALEEAGVKADKATAQACLSEMDRDGTGKVNFDEFLIALRPPLSDTRTALINTAFDKLDASGDGVVSLDDVRGVYSAAYHPKFISGEMTEDDVFRQWLQQLGADPSGTITRDDFINYYVGVSSSIDDDEYFDQMMRSAWKL